MEVSSSVVRLGLEVEVPMWEGGRSYHDVASDLVDAGFMRGPAWRWEEVHQYHCNCDEGGCNLVRRGDILEPPLTAMTYDASLPFSGAEFIVSPVLVDVDGLSRLEEIWNIIADGAVWQVPEGVLNRRDGPVSPSIHMHVSAVKTGVNGGRANRAFDRSDDTFHLLGLFAPELFLLADLAGVRRGAYYRLPDRESVRMFGGGNGVHHGMVHVREMTTHVSYIEWRVFEAVYQDWSYLFDRAYLAAALTRALLSPATFSILFSAGYAKPYDSGELAEAAGRDDVGRILDLVDQDRLGVLNRLVVEELADDEAGVLAVSRMFAQADKFLLNGRS